MRHLCNDIDVKRDHNGYLASTIQFETIIGKRVLSDNDIAKGISIIEGVEDCSVIATKIPSDRSPGSNRLGITGSPGVGKSTFMGALLTLIDSTKIRIAVIAVDPSSHKTYGAILADRVRLKNNFVFEHIFFRSMATRGAYGGLVNNIDVITNFLEFAGFDLIVIESVGVGQNEVEINSNVDFVIHILDSNVGDEVQIEKAGIMEIGDIFFINKDDRGINTNYLSAIKKSVDYQNQLLNEDRKVVVGSALELRGLSDVIDCLNMKFDQKLPIRSVAGLE